MYLNPQYLLRFSAQSRCVVVLQRDDHSRFGGFCVLARQKGSVRLRLADVTSQLYDIVAQSPVSNQPAVTALFDVDPERDYVLIPYLLNRGETGAFLVRICHPNADLSVAPVPAAHVATAAGEHNLKAAGGTPVMQTWPHNPQFLLTVSAQSLVQVTFAQQLTDAASVDPVQLAVSGAGSLLPVAPHSLVRLGFCVCRGAERRQRFDASEVVLAPEDWPLTFGLRAGSVSAEGVLEAGQYVVATNTGSQRERCAYTVTVTAEQPVTLSALPPA